MAMKGRQNTKKSECRNLFKCIPLEEQGADGVVILRQVLRIGCK
jgi:hypothetical protein